MTTDDDVTLGELGRRLTAHNENMVRELGSLRGDIASIRADAVLRTEYEIRMTGMDREIRDLKTKVDSKSVPWPQVASVVISAVALLVVIIPLVAN